MVNEFKEEVGEVLKDPNLPLVSEFDWYQSFKDKTYRGKLFKTIGKFAGTASKQQFKDLKEEGIETEVIPWINEKEN